MILILLIAALALISIDHAGMESASSARSRSSARALHAADGGAQLAIARLSQSSPDTDPIDITIGDFSVQSRTRADALPLDLDVSTGSASGPPPGYSVTGGGPSFSTQLYTVSITAVGPNGATAEVRGKFYTLASGLSSY